jgi:acetoin utilization deacetylase AcuC-like enzyme
MQVTPEGFAILNRDGFHEETCEGKVVFVLEGGYHLDGLRDSVRQVLKKLRGDTPDGRRGEKLRESVDHRMIDPVIKKVKEAQKPFWKNLC